MKEKRTLTKKLLGAILLTLLLGISLTPNLAKESSTPSDWAITYVEMAHKLNLVPEDMELNYQEAITRQKFCAFIVQTYENLSGVTLDPAAELPFTDTEDEWVSKAYEKGIVMGVSENSFASMNTITRQEIMVMMYRSIQFMEKDLGREILQQNIGNPMVFQDEDSIASWAKEAVMIAVGNELVKGVGQNRIQPKGVTTVEEAITLITRLAAFVDASEEDVFFEQGNYVRDGRWWAYDGSSKTMEESLEFTNVKEACFKLVLKRDGSVFIQEPLIAEEPSISGDTTAATWQQFGLNNVLHVSKNQENYDSKFYCVRLDGSVWECDDSALSYQAVSLPEKIKQIKVGTYVTYAVGDSGKLYYWSAISDIKSVEEIGEITDISVYEDISRAQDREGNVWEWGMSFDGNQPILEKPEKTELSYEYLDYYQRVSIEEGTLPLGEFIRYDDSYYSRLFILGADEKLYIYNDSDFSYKDLPFEVKDMKGYTFLDSKGSVLEYWRPSRADGFQFVSEPLLIPGLTEVVAIDEDIALRKDGTIWSWGYRYPEEIMEEHQIGQLDKSMMASEFTRIIHYKGYVYLLNQSKQVLQLEDYETQKVKSRIGVQTPVLLLEDIQDLGYGWFLNGQGQVGSYDASGESNIILEQIIQLSSNEELTIALHENGKMFSMSSWSLTEFTEVENVSPMQKVWAADLYYPYFALAETKEGALMFITNTYDIETGDQRRYEIPFNVKNYEDFYLTGMDLMVKKKSGITKAWFIYDSYFIFDGTEKEFGPEPGLKELIGAF